MNPRGWAAGLVAVLGVALTGCGGGSEPDTPSPTSSAGGPSTSRTGVVLPARTATLRLDGVSMCSLITQQQLPMFGGLDQIPNAGALPAEPGVQFPGADCIWGGADPDYGWLGRFAPGQGVETALNGAERVVGVQGFSAIQVSPRFVSPSTHCGLYVDIAPGQTLLATFDNASGDDPTMTHEKACQQAARLASEMIKTARAQGR
ncbi:MAG: DUF3558 family protein [Pseudonocardia sp.]